MYALRVNSLWLYLARIHHDTLVLHPINTKCLAKFNYYKLITIRIKLGFQSHVHIGFKATKEDFSKYLRTEVSLQ